MTAPKPPNRLRARTSVTLDPATLDRLAAIVAAVAGVKSLSAAIDYAAQYTADRLATPPPPHVPSRRRRVQ